MEREHKILYAISFGAVLLVLVLMAVVLAAGSGGMRKKCDVCWPGRHPSLSGQHIKRR